jgi:hypothetical protein
MKNYFQKYRFIFAAFFVAILLLSVLVLIDNTKVNNNETGESTHTVSAVNTPENPEYKASSEEKEVPHFNIFTIINKFIPN